MLFNYNLYGIVTNFNFTIDTASIKSETYTVKLNCIYDKFGNVDLIGTKQQ